VSEILLCKGWLLVIDFFEWPWVEVAGCAVSRKGGAGGIMISSGTTTKFIGNEASNTSIGDNFSC